MTSKVRLCQHGESGHTAGPRKLVPGDVAEHMQFKIVDDALEDKFQLFEVGECFSTTPARIDYPFCSWCHIGVWNAVRHPNSADLLNPAEAILTQVSKTLFTCLKFAALMPAVRSQSPSPLYEVLRAGDSSGRSRSASSQRLNARVQQTRDRAPTDPGTGALKPKQPADGWTYLDSRIF